MDGLSSLGSQGWSELNVVLVSLNQPGAAVPWTGFQICVELGGYGWAAHPASGSVAFMREVLPQQGWDVSLV